MKRKMILRVSSRWGEVKRTLKLFRSGAVLVTELGSLSSKFIAL